MTEQVLEKVTAFITRCRNNHIELLLFEHQSAGIQIPAGTVDPGETTAQAVVREAEEETGLTQLGAPHFLGDGAEDPADGQACIYETTTVYPRPHFRRKSPTELRRGSTVETARETGNFVQVNYCEYERATQPHYVSYQIKGWVPRRALAWRRQRFFYHLPCLEETPEHWTTDFDGPTFSLFWAPLDDLPSIVPAQAVWLSFLTAANAI